MYCIEETYWGFSVDENIFDTLNDAILEIDNIIKETVRNIPKIISIMKDYKDILDNSEYIQKWIIKDLHTKQVVLCTVIIVYENGEYSIF